MGECADRRLAQDVEAIESLGWLQAPATVAARERFLTPDPIESA